MKLFSKLIASWTLLASAALAAGPAPGDKLWSFATDQTIQSSPAIAADGTIYFGNDAGMITALNREGGLKWEYKTGGSIASSPAIGADGTIYVGSIDRVLYALSPEGKLKWIESPGSGMVASPAIARDGTLIVGTVFNSLVAISSSGTRRWVFQAAGNLVSSPAIGPDGTIYVGCRDNRLYALTADGKRKWTFTTGASINASPAIGADGAIYIGSLDHKLCAVNPDGSKRWEFVAGDAIRSSAAVAADGTIYFGCDDGKLYAVTSEGGRKWTFSTGEWIRSSPAIGADGVVYVGSYDNSVYAVNPDGTKKWQFTAGSHVSSSPALGSDGTVYVGSWDKTFYALKGSAPLADAPWPVFRHDSSRSGRTAAQKTPIQVELTIANLIRTYQAPATIRLTAEVIGAADAKVEFYQGRVKIGEASRSPCSLVWANVLAGSYSLTAKAILPSGDTLDSKPIEVTVTATATAAKSVPIKTVRKSVKPAPRPEPAMPDKTKPVVAIVSPARNSSVSTAELSLRGTASDNAGVMRVEYQLGKGPFTPAEGTTDWQAKLRLSPGENTVQVRAIDHAGNQSSVVRHTILYVAKAPLQLKIEGDGIIRSTLEDRELEIGETYSLTAEPRHGMVFFGWTGSLQTNTPTVTFVMTENFQLQANFAPNRFAAFKGEYTALIDPPGLSNPEVTGIISIATGEKGACHGQLQLGGDSYPLKGQFDATGAMRQTIERSHKSPLTVVLRLDLASDPDLITGSVSDGVTTTEILGDRLIFDGKAKKAPQQGRYTLTMTAKADSGPAPQGDGFGQLSVDERGIVRFEGALGDGTTAKQEVALTKNGVWPVYLPLYDGRGSLSGWIRFKSESYGDLFGQLTWIKPASPKDKRYPAGFTNQVSVLGSAYVPPEGRGSLGTGGGSSGLLRFKSGNFSDLLIGGIEVNANYKIALPEAYSRTLKLKIANQTGLFTGTFVHPVTGEATAFEGTLLQKQGSGAGHFLDAQVTGHVLLGISMGPGTPASP